MLASKRLNLKKFESKWSRAVVPASSLAIKVRSRKKVEKKYEKVSREDVATGGGARPKWQTNQSASCCVSAWSH